MKKKSIFCEKVKKYLVALSAVAGVTVFLSLTSLLTGCSNKAVATPTPTPTTIVQVPVTNVPQVITPIPSDTPVPTFTPTPVAVSSTNTPTPTPTRKPTATPTPAGFAGVEITPKTGVVFATDSINIRTGPGTSYRVIGGGKPNEEFNLSGECSNGWWQIKYKGDVAYISQEYSALKGSTPTVTAKPSVTSTPTPTPVPVADIPSFEDYVGFNGKAYCVIDAETGKILYALNEDKKLQPASLTKMLTAVVVAEQIYFDDVSTTHQKALHWNTISYKGQEIKGDDDEMSTYAAKVGGKYTLEQWMETEYSVEERLYMMLLLSAADSAEALCYQICDSVDFFVDLMADKAEQIGLENSNFNNPVGADASSGYDGIYSTASDLCKVAKKLLEDPTLRKIVSTNMYTVPASGSIPATTIKNTNLLISDPNYMSEYFTCTGIKTGNTTDAGYCLAASGKNAAGKEVIVVTLGGKSRASNAEETVRILEYVFKYNKDYQ